MSTEERPEAIHPWRATVLTIFPEMFPGPLGHSLSGKALDARIWTLETVDIRDFARDKHGSVDDTPFGGGPGMVMRPDVVDDALRSVLAPDQPDHRAAARPVIYLSPRGKPLDQSRARALADGDGAILLAGRYEGVDQRVLDAHGLEEVSLGDYVLSGGEVAAMVLLDAVVRLLPGVAGNQASLEDESFAPENGGALLEYPQFTRPQEWNGKNVPEVLLSGHHEKIRAWRQAQAEALTRARRPDLWARYRDETQEGRDR